MGVCFIVGFWADYEQLFFEAAEEVAPNQFKIINLKKISSGSSLRSKLLWKLFRKKYYAREIQALSGVPSSCFLFQDNKHCLNMIRELKLPNLTGVFCRDPLDAKPAVKVQILHVFQQGIPVWSFDPEDCKTYGLNHYNQFIKKLGVSSTSFNRTDLLFIGRDKGRGEYLRHLSKKLRTLGWKVDIEIKSSESNDKKRSIPISYPIYIKRVLETKCIIDLVQKGQRGLTLRPLEALVYGKKLVTNNPFLKDQPFYHPDNIFVIDEKSDENNIHEFLQRPQRPIAPEIIDQYLTVNVLKRVVEQLVESQ